ncbi:MAG: hypothetical protein F4119_07395 [Acidimicrobiia bacterium]|nr:hypothetical protein [Acidimicrobiia bacterium]
MLIAGCGNSGTDTPSTSEVFVPPTPTPDLLPTEDDLRDRFEGTVTEPYDLLIGTCFNQYTYLDRNDLPAQLTTAVGCSRQHNAQIYAIIIHPAAAATPYPNEKTLNEWGQAQCYKQFEPFVGEVYEKSQLDIGMITPSRSDWEGEDKRRQISCFVHSYEGLLIIGDMRNIGL